MTSQPLAEGEDDNDQILKRSNNMTSQPLAEGEDDDDQTLKRRIKNEALLTANLGYGNSKKRLLEAFNKIVWPRLVDEGWTQVRGTSLP